LPNSLLDEKFRSAAFVVIESGLGIVLIRRAKALNKSAKIIYRASDKLDTIGAPDRLQTELRRTMSSIDYICLLAAKMASNFAWAGNKRFLVPLGIHPPDFEEIGPSPYSAQLNAVSVGSMLFDPGFFLYAAAEFPHIEFHIIGCGTTFAAPNNVHIYSEMPFKDTLPFVKHASFGIAAYKDTENAEYLSQSSLKLMQFELLGIPAVCPAFAVGESQNRFGYDPKYLSSIDEAIKLALRRIGNVTRPKFLTWEEITKRLLAPFEYGDTVISTEEVSGTADDFARERASAFSRVLMQARKPTISLIVCTIGRSEKLERLFVSLSIQNCADFEIIVVDQNPDGFLTPIINNYRDKLTLTVVKSERGLSKARNIGLKLAKGDIVCFPDDDCWYRPSTLEDAVKYLAENPDVDILLGKTVDSNGYNSLSAFRDSSGTVSKWNLWSSGNSNTLFIRREGAQLVGNFDEDLGVGAATRFQSGEESDFILRALALGKRAFFYDGLLIHHEQVDEQIGDTQIKRAQKYSLGFGRVLRKHQFGLPYLLYRTARSCLRALISLAFLNLSQARYKIAWALGTWQGYFARP